MCVRHNPQRAVPPDLDTRFGRVYPICNKYSIPQNSTAQRVCLWDGFTASLDTPYRRVSARFQSLASDSVTSHTADNAADRLADYKLMCDDTLPHAQSEFVSVYLCMQYRMSVDEHEVRVRKSRIDLRISLIDSLCITQMYIRIIFL